MQERWFARLYLLLPIVVAVLAAFWTISGAIALVDLDAAATQSGLPAGSARWAVAIAALVDVKLTRDTCMKVDQQQYTWVGLSSCSSSEETLPLSLNDDDVWQLTARAASWGMVVVGVGYLAAASVTRPDLWADPLGPLLKVLPATMLAVVAATLLDSGR